MEWTELLRCDLCGRQSDRLARKWRAELVDDREMRVMCGDCAGELARRRLRARRASGQQDDPRSLRLIALESEEREISDHRKALHRQIDRLRRDLGVL